MIYHLACSPKRPPAMLRILCGTMVLIAGLAARASASGEDRIILQPKEGTSRIALSCTIADYTGREITVIPYPGAAPKSYPAAEVVEVQTAYTASHQRGLELFQKGQTADAQHAFETALTEEVRGWVRREILAMLVQCAMRQQDFATAATRFLLLVDGDPETRHFHLIPLIWAPQEVSPSLKSRARAWLNDSSEVARLLGASYLLDDSRLGELAETAIQELSVGRDVRVRQLARVQHWRTKLRTTDIPASILDLWENRILELPPDLRGGAYYLLGRGHLLRREYSRAAAALLWLPLVYPKDHVLAGRACLEAARCLERIGQTEEAAQLYRETVDRFGDTPFSADAAAYLREAARRSESPPPASPGFPAAETAER